MVHLKLKAMIATHSLSFIFGTIFLILIRRLYGNLDNYEFSNYVQINIIFGISGILISPILLKINPGSFYPVLYLTIQCIVNSTFGILSRLEPFSSMSKDAISTIFIGISLAVVFVF